MKVICKKVKMRVKIKRMITAEMEGAAKVGTTAQDHSASASGYNDQQLSDLDADSASASISLVLYTLYTILSLDYIDPTLLNMLSTLNMILSNSLINH
jgi:hypothetical protein